MARDTSDDLDDLIARVALRDRRAFDMLYTQASGRLFAVAVRMMKDRAEAEDVMQEAFIRIWQKAESFRPGQARAMGWLVAILRNLAIDRLRARKGPTLPIDMAEEVPDAGPGPEASAAQKDERARIDGCLDKLEEKRAEAVRSAYIEGYSYQELADRFETPLNTIRTWLRRSLLSLRACLERAPS